MHTGLSGQIGLPAAGKPQTILHGVTCKDANIHESNRILRRFQTGEIAPCLLATRFAVLGHHQQQQQQKHDCNA